MTRPDHLPGELDQLEVLMDRAWRAPEHEVFAGWILRSGGSVTQRANSVWPAVAAVNPEASLKGAADWYAARRQPVIFQLTHRPENAPLEEVLDRKGYSRQSQTLIMTADGSRASGVGEMRADDGSQESVHIQLAENPTDEWLELWWRVDGRGGPAERNIAMSIIVGTPSVYASAMDAKGSVIGTGRLSVLGEWGGVYCMATHPEFRRRGVASAVLEALLAAGRSAGAEKFWLMATEANTAAQALYQRAGFIEVGRYHYRQARRLL